MSEVQQWHLAGDWFDVCKCAIPCPCTFAQAPTYGDCDGILAWHIREGHYGDARLDGLNVVGLGSFEGNVWAGEFASFIGEVRGIEYAPITFEIADDLAYWAAEVPGKATARAEALTGPTTSAGQRVQVHNAPGAEVGPGQIATWGRATADRADGFGFKWEWDGRSSKHFPFDWQGPSSSGRATTCPLLLPGRSSPPKPNPLETGSPVPTGC